MAYKIKLKRLCLSVLLSLFTCSGALAETINVAVASNFAATLEDLVLEFQSETGHQVNIISGSSGRHYAQITNGAPFDLFLSADTARPRELQESGLITGEQRRVYALGRLALWTRDTDTQLGAGSLADFFAQEGGRLAIANPLLAPYGKAAMEALDGLGLADAAQRRLVRGENVGQSFQFAYSESARFAFVAYSQVLSLAGTGSYWLPPQDSYSPISQEMVLLDEGEAARALFEYLSDDSVRSQLDAYGYRAPSSSSPDVTDAQRGGD